MTQTIAVFAFENTQVRTLGTAESPLFVAIDIAKALGFKDQTNAIKLHVDPEDITRQEILDNLGRKQTVNCVNESGMYALIFGSKLESAKRFKRWVTSEVLPAIRRTGRYEVPTGDTITNAQQVAIQQAVARRAKKTAAHYQTIYRAIKARYQIPRYSELPKEMYEDCVRFIDTVDLYVPEVPEQKPEAAKVEPPKEEETYTVRRDFLERQMNFVYMMRYLCREPLLKAVKIMQALDVPDASTVIELCDGLHFAMLENNLRKLGFDVKEMDCYKHWASTRQGRSC